MIAKAFMPNDFTNAVILMPNCFTNVYNIYIKRFHPKQFYECI